MNLKPRFSFSPNELDHAGDGEVTGSWTRFKNGKVKHWQSYAVTWLRKCDHCGLLGSPRRVAYRSECYVSEWPRSNDIDLCVSCWNRYRVLVKAKTTLDECKYLIRKVLRLAVVPRAA